MALKLWHLLALSGFVWACAQQERPPQQPPAPSDPPEPDEPLDPRRQSTPEIDIFVHERELVPVFLKASERIHKASGVKVHVNRRGGVMSAIPVFGSDFLCPNGTDGWSAREFMAMARDCRVDPEKVAVHELLHQLGVTDHLVPPKRGITLAATDDPTDTITADDLEALCAVRECSVFAPES